MASNRDASCCFHSGTYFCFMPDIPVEFELKGKVIKGRLSKVAGAGDTSIFHLNDDKNFYCGRLRRHNDQWVFDPNPKDPELKDLADYFGDVVTAWYE